MNILKRHLLDTSESNKKLLSLGDLATLLPSGIYAVANKDEAQELYQLWEDAYKEVYPSFVVPQDDPQNTQAHILYTRNAAGQVNSSIRLTLDSPLGMPSEGYYPHEVSLYRQHGYRLMEFGRMVSTEKNIALLKTYHKLVYLIAQAEQVDIIIMTLKQKDVNLYSNIMGACLLSADMGIPHGGKSKVSCVAWDIRQTRSRFFNWVNLAHQSQGEIA